MSVIHGKEQQFWTWFKQREDALFNFDRDQERIFDEIDMALANVSSLLTFEFGPVTNGVREFVISADGVKSGFPAVEALAAAAPVLPQWNIIKFRQRQTPILELSYADKTVNPSDVEFCLLSNGRELGVYLFFDAYSEDETLIWRNIGFLLLDQALGEFDVATKVGPIEVFHSDAHPDAARFTLSEPITPSRAGGLKGNRQRRL